MTGDRMSRLGRHLIQQRSIYPLFPYAEGAQISATLADGLTLPCSPDVLIVPSNLVPFAKRCGETLLLNPGLFHTHLSTILMVMVTIMVIDVFVFSWRCRETLLLSFCLLTDSHISTEPTIPPYSPYLFMDVQTQDLVFRAYAPHTCLWTRTLIYRPLVED